jgi:hypothetical protein
MRSKLYSTTFCTRQSLSENTVHFVDIQSQISFKTQEMSMTFTKLPLNFCIQYPKSRSSFHYML